MPDINDDGEISFVPEMLPLPTGVSTSVVKAVAKKRCGDRLRLISVSASTHPAAEACVIVNFLKYYSAPTTGACYIWLLTRDDLNMLASNAGNDFFAVKAHEIVEGIVDCCEAEMPGAIDA